MQYVVFIMGTLNRLARSPVQCGAVTCKKWCRVVRILHRSDGMEWEPEELVREGRWSWMGTKQSGKPIDQRRCRECLRWA